MPHSPQEIARRTSAALTAIRDSADENDEDSGVALFASHHLEELDAAYWQNHVGTSRPTAKQVLDLLVLSSHWSDDDDDGIETFDFTLPDDVTNYVISVRFDESGEVEDISMES